ncbi:hypothetical protein U1Q18_045250 [Sarracenia purpurea var. burkii]
MSLGLTSVIIQWRPTVPITVIKFEGSSQGDRRKESIQQSACSWYPVFLPFVANAFSGAHRCSWGYQAYVLMITRWHVLWCSVDYGGVAGVFALSSLSCHNMVSLSQSMFLALVQLILFQSGGLLYFAVLWKG